MYTWGQLKTETRILLFPSGEADNLVVAHDKAFIDAIIDLQTWVPCLQQDNTTLVQQCESLFKCGMTLVDAPRGAIKGLSVIDKINQDTRLEDPDAEDDWCSEVFYPQVEICHVHRYIDWSRRCGRCLPCGRFFGLPFFGFRPYPTPTDEGLPAGLAPLDLGHHYPQESTNRTWGRAGAGVWAQERGKIYIAPWLQTTETVIIKWDGIKRVWTDADPIDQDPLLSKAIEEYVRWQHARKYDKDSEDAITSQGAYAEARMMLIHQCREETRVRDCEPSHARQASTMGGSTSALFYNTEQSASAQCPDDTTGSPVSVTIPAGTVGSNVSVADANQKALQQATTQATAQLVCTPNPVTYWNTAQTAIAACDQEDGAPVPVGDAVTVTVPAHTVSSTVSQADADSLGYAQALAEAKSQRSCTYGNKEQTASASCPANTSGPDVSVTIAADTYHSTVSQADADAQAYSAAKSQAYEQVVLGCSGGPPTFGNTQQSVFAQAYTTTCPSPLGGTMPGFAQVTVIVPPNAFFNVSQNAANTDANNAGLAFAQQLAAQRAAAGQCGTHTTTYPNP